MAESSVGIRPSTTTGSVDVLVDEHNGKVVPVYKEAFGDADNITRVDANNRLPVQTEREPLADVLSCLQRIEKELKKMNIYNALAQNEEISNEDIE